MIILEYTITKEIITDGEIVGYEVIDKSGRVRRAKLEDIIKLADKKMIDCQVFEDAQGIKHILYNKPENYISNEESYTIECRIIQGGKLTGYKCKNKSGDIKRLSPAKVWELAAIGCIENAEAKVVNNQPTIVGKGQSLSEISVLTL